MLKAVLDTNVIISALISDKGKPNQVLRQAGTTFQLVLSDELLEEIDRVLHESKIQKRSGMSETEIEAFLVTLRLTAILVENVPPVQVVEDDPDDDKVLACAKEAGTDYIVSGDTHLLDLESYEGIQIVAPARFWDILPGIDG